MAKRPLFHDGVGLEYLPLARHTIPVNRFQDLVGCLLLQEVSKHVRIFAKRGRDYFVDASYTGAYADRPLELTHVR